MLDDLFDYFLYGIMAIAAIGVTALFILLFIGEPGFFCAVVGVFSAAIVIGWFLKKVCKL